MTKKVIETNNNICDDCIFGEWNTDFYNLDLDGNPITLRCPFYFDNKIGIIRGTKACKRFTTI